MGREWDNAFDFPCSYTFRRYEAWTNEEVELPAIDRQLEEDMQAVKEHHKQMVFSEISPPVKVTVRQWEEIDQIKLWLRYFEKTLNEHITKTQRAYVNRSIYE